MAMIHISRSGATLGIFEEEKVREGLRTGQFIGTDLGWMEGMPTWRPLSELESFRAPVPVGMLLVGGLRRHVKRVQNQTRSQQIAGVFQAIGEDRGRMREPPDQQLGRGKRSADGHPHGRDALG